MLLKDKATKETFKFNYRQVLELDRLGIFGDQRVELLDGEIIPMPPPNPPHAIFVMEIGDTLTLELSHVAKIASQNPLRLSLDLEDKHLPVPDIMVLKRRLYLDHPQPEDVYLLIEVADSSLSEDRGRKLRLYAAHSVREYWIINLVNKQIEVYTQPKGDEYLSRQTYQLTERIAPQQFPENAKPWVAAEVLQILE